MKNIRQLSQTANRNAGKLFLIGIAAVAAYNWRLWQRDKALAERLRNERPPLPKLARTPRVSALVAAWNEGQNIDAHIQSFLALEYPDIELILCAGGADDTLARARKYECERVIVLEQRPGEGKQKALARCFEQASGEIIYLTDADCLFDDNSLLGTVYPIVAGQETACTGGARPLTSLLEHPFVVAQAVSDVRMYADDKAPNYLPGLLGRNCAIDRDLLEQSGGLNAQAPTGTDYVLAKELTAAGARIRQVRKSQVATEYPTNPGAYVQQRRRWLRSVVVQGHRYGAQADVRASLRTSFMGLVMLALPLASLRFGPVPMLAWLLAFLNGFLARLRYLRFAQLIHGWPFSWRHIAALIEVLLLDFVAWAAPLLDYLQPSRREEW